MTVSEQRLLLVLLTADFPGRDAIMEQLESVAVTAIDDEGSLRFHPRVTKIAHVERRIPVEAETEDADGVTVHLLLHVIGGILDELEIYREDSSPLRQPIDLSRLRIMVL